MKKKRTPYFSGVLFFWGRLMKLNGYSMGREEDTISKFAQDMDMSIEDTNKLLDGNLLIDEAIASKLERIIGIPKESWLNIKYIRRDISGN